MTDPRDKYVSKHPTPTGGRTVTPAGGVNTRPITQPESWDDDGAYTDVGARGTERSTPVGGVAVARTVSDSELLQHTARRAGIAQNAALDTRRTATETQKVASSTFDRVDKIEGKVDKLEEKIDAAFEVIGDVRVDVGKHGVQIETAVELLREVKDHVKRTEHVKETTWLAKTEVDKSRQLTDTEIDKAKALADIEERRADRALRRENIKTVLKWIAAIGTLVGAIISAYLLGTKS